MLNLSQSEKNQVLKNLQSFTKSSDFLYSFFENKKEIIDLIKSDLKIADVNATLWRAITDAPTSRQAVKVYRMSEAVESVGVYNLDINEKLNLLYLTNDRATNSSVRSILEASQNLADKKYVHKDPLFCSLCYIVANIRSAEAGKSAKKEGRGKTLAQILKELEYIQVHFPTFTEEERESIKAGISRLAKEL